MLLSDLIPFLRENKNNVKIHFAQPEDALTEFLMGDFKSWQEEQNHKNFEKDYILSLIRLDDGEWLFAGIYKSFGAKELKDCYKYRTRLTEIVISKIFWKRLMTNTFFVALNSCIVEVHYD